MAQGHQIARKTRVEDFLNEIKECPKGNITCTRHTFFRLSEKQREVLTEEKLKDLICAGCPVLAGIQNNGCVSAFYRWEKKKFIRIIMDNTYNRIEVVTFYIIDEFQLPR